MRIRLVPTLAALYYVAMIFFVTYPGYVPFDRIRPFVLGMPFSMFWQVMWICGAIFVLAGVFFWEKGRRADRQDSSERGSPSSQAGGE